jgi:hypothetical protein
MNQTTIADSRPRYSGHLSYNDVRALREQIKCAPFVHIPRLALEWGVTVESIKSAAGNLAGGR